METTIAWLVLRIVYAWLFLYPLRVLLKDFEPTVNLVALIAPYKPRFFAVLMVIVMIFGALMILFGVYARFAGFMLCIYNIVGMVVHYKLAASTVDLGDSTYPIRLVLKIKLFSVKPHSLEPLGILHRHKKMLC